MSKLGDKFESSFSRPAIYQIKVLGKVAISRSENLLGMKISHQEDESGFVTTLIGKLKSQAELSEVLNALHNSHTTLLTVEKLDL